MADLDERSSTPDEERDAHGRRSSTPGGVNSGGFLTTRWSLVRAARSSDLRDVRAAMTGLCEAYWFPLYAYVRRRGHGDEEARDLTQGFFARWLEKRDLGGADPAHGRFRAYLLSAVKHYVLNEHDRERAQKRGGGEVISIDADADERFLLDPCHHLTPERVFERSWALALLARTLARLRAEYAADGRGPLFEALEGTLAGHETDEPRRVLAERLGTSEGALNVAAHRLRRRYRELLRAEIAETVADPADVEAELRDLFAALA